MNYRRLPGSAAAPFRRVTLWLGPDHVLAVRSGSFVEEYRRFYLRDIQALVLAETGDSWTCYLVSFAIFLAVFTAALAYSRHYIWAGVACVFAIVLGLVGMRIPNCACYLKTATTTERLPSLGRLRAAHKTIAILRPAIEGAQR